MIANMFKWKCSFSSSSLQLLQVEYKLIANICVGVFLSRDWNAAAGWRFIETKLFTLCGMEWPYFEDDDQMEWWQREAMQQLLLNYNASEKETQTQ